MSGWQWFAVAWLAVIAAVIVWGSLAARRRGRDLELRDWYDDGGRW